MFGENGFGLNIAYVLELYDRFRENPEAVDMATREFFSHWSPPPESYGREGINGSVEKVAGAVTLAQSIRAYGHLAAKLDPLGSKPRGDPSLAPETHGITENDLRELPAILIGGPVAATAENAQDAISKLRAIYASTIGYDYDHLHVPEERDWLRHVTESGAFSSSSSSIDPLSLLERLTQVETFEHFLHRTFPGKTRFSIEGLDMMVPILDDMIAEASKSQVHNIFIGMAHRGRLNILAHILGKPYRQILAEFKDPSMSRDLTARETLGWTGDVKYHAGAQREIDGQTPTDITISLPPNPSHVESADPVIEGMAHAAGADMSQAGAPRYDYAGVLPILIHGDAAFPGQGIVAETLNMSRLEGFQTGGTIHIIANNQLGYTTEPAASRSTLYASDLAKGFEIPVIHVNADDVEACILVARMAHAYRSRFHRDLLIDLIGYRRYGHNEGDEPTFTQPVLYETIARHPTVRQVWADTLKLQGLVDDQTVQGLVAKFSTDLQHEFESLDPEKDLVEPIPTAPPPRAAKQVKTNVPVDRLREINAALLHLPKDFTPTPKIERALRRRTSLIDKPDEKTIDWATAEQLAFATILADGIPIRLTGEDVERGTFSQRHSVFHDVKTGARWTPLQTIPQARAAFSVFDSSLSEVAALAFEYGYSIQAPEQLVLWEAQYGDFVNGAQMVIDEFIASARSKWGQTPSLGMLLPHGFEGAGPDHSSARLERFLGLAAETNLRVVNPTTSAQYFHLLRRQAHLLRTDPLPLVVMTPKSLLRHPGSASSLRELAEGLWQPLIDDAGAVGRREQIRRLVLCSGKVYIDLVTSEFHQRNKNVAIVRLEQLYPFPEAEVKRLLEEYARLSDVVWLQEEPENMGAWSFVQPQVDELLQQRVPFKYLGRLPNSSPAEGSLAQHIVNQRTLLEKAFAELAEEVTI